MNIIRVALLFMCGYILAGCSHMMLFTTGLSDFGTSQYDERLIGTWYTVDGDDPILIRIDPIDLSDTSIDASLRVRYLDSASSRSLSLIAYPSEFDGEVYYNIKPETASYKRAFPEATEKPHFILLKTEFVDDDMLYLWSTSYIRGERFAAPGTTPNISSGRIKKTREVRCGHFCMYYLVEQSRKELHATIRDITPERFFPVQFGPFTRLAEPAKVLEANNWYFDEQTGCGVVTAENANIIGVKWSGKCQDGRASGPGQADWILADHDIKSFEGTMVRGRPHDTGRCRPGCLRDWHVCQYDHGKLVHKPEWAGRAPAYKRLRALADVALMQARVGANEDANRTIRDVLELAGSIPEQCLEWLGIARVYTTIAQTLVYTGDTEGAKSIAERFSRRHEERWLLIAESQIEAGDLAGALLTAERADKYKGRILAQIAMVQADSGDPELALETAQKIPADWPLDADFFTAKQEGRSGHSVEPEYYCKRETGFMQTERQLCHDWMYYAIAQSRLEANDLEGALNSAKKILKSTFRDQFYKNLALSRLEKNDRHGAIISVKLVRNNNQQAHAYLELAKHLAEKDFIQDAHEALRLAMEFEPDSQFSAQHLTHVAETQLAVGKPQDALKTAEMVYQLAVTNPRVGFYLGDITAIQVAAGDLEAARASVQLIIKNFKSHWDAQLAKAQASIGDIDAAKARALKYEACHSRSEALYEIANIQKSRGDFTGAAETLLLTVYEWDRKTGIDHYLLYTIIEESVKLGVKPGKLLDALKSMEHGNVLIKALNTIAVSQYTMGDTKGADETLDRVIDELRAVYPAFGLRMTELIGLHVNAGNTRARDRLLEYWFCQARSAASVDKLLDVADAQLRFADKESARKTVSGANETARNIPVSE